jgi:hypothetical protein
MILFLTCLLTTTPAEFLFKLKIFLRNLDFFKIFEID